MSQAQACQVIYPRRQPSEVRIEIITCALLKGRLWLIRIASFFENREGLSKEGGGENGTNPTDLFEENHEDTRPICLGLDDWRPLFNRQLVDIDCGINRRSIILTASSDQQMAGSELHIPRMTA